MFKKISKVLFSTSLAMLMGGAGLLTYTKLAAGKPAVADVSSLSVTINDETYTLKGVDRGGKTFYQITSSDDLSLFSYMVSVAKNTTWASANFEVTNDINLQNSSWTPIGTYDNPYSGIFNGNGYTINGLNVPASSTDDIYLSTVDYRNDSTSKPAPITPVNNAYYYIDSDAVSLKHSGEYASKYYLYDDVRGYQLVDEEDVPANATVNHVYAYDAAYYGLFGYVKGTDSEHKAEITDIVMGRNAYVHKEEIDKEIYDTEDYRYDWVDAGYDIRYSGILVAYAENTKFYNVYDSSAEFNVSYSEETGYFANVGAYTTAGDGIHYYLDNGDFILIPSDNVTNYVASYVKIYKLNTGLDTYYYAAGQGSLYSTINVVDQVGSFSGSVTASGLNVNSSAGEALVKDKAYRYEVDEDTKAITLVLKDRYILSDTATSSVVIDGTSYYYESITGGFELYTENNNPHTTSPIEIDTVYANTPFGLVGGKITVGGITHEFIWNEGGDYELRILNGHELFTVGYATTNCEIYKGQYYRLNSLQYVGIGAIDENVNYNGTINISGTTYYYVYNIESNQLFFYADSSLSYPSYTGRGNENGVGSISINGTDYIFAFRFLTGDLELSALSSYSTKYPYTIEKVQGAMQVEELNLGQIISFNATMPNSSNAGLFYMKGKPDFLTSYSLLCVNGTLSEINYSSNLALKTTLPKSFTNAGDNQYYVINNAAGNKFKYWTVPDVTTGKETIVYSDAFNGLHSYILSSDTSVDGEKTYYSFANESFAQIASPEGNPSTSSYYEKIGSSDTIDNIIANNYEVNAVWATKNYNVYVDINGTVTNKTVGYGTRWETYASTLTRAGYDLTGVYYYSSGYGTSGSTTGDKIYGYSLQYEYDNYGNLSTFSYVKTQDQEIVEGKDYYTCGVDMFFKVSSPSQAQLANYYERVNEATYGKAFGAETLGYDYFITIGDSATTPENIYVYTEWVKRPVFGKVKFTNTSDAYILTTDTAIDSSKTYYTESAGVYTPVASPVVANIGTYYEATTRFVEGKITYFAGNFEETASHDNGSTNYFFKVSKTQDFTQLGFRLATGYKVNYVTVSNGAFAITDVDYYYYDGSNRYHRYYDSTEGEIVTSSALVYGGSYSDTAGISNPEEGAIYSIGGRYFVYDSSVSDFVEVLYLDWLAGSYEMNLYQAFDTGFTIYIDIERVSYEATLNITPAPGFEDSVAGKASFELVQDGKTVDSGTISGTTQTINFKYDSTYELIVNPTTEAYVIESTNDPLVSNITTFTVNFQNGIATFNGTVNTISSNPSFTVRITYDKFKVFTEYDYEAGSSNVSGSVLPLLQVASLKQNDENLYGTQSYSSGGYEFYNYSGSAHIAISDNAYYSVTSKTYAIYSVAATNVTGTATVVSVGATFAQVSFNLGAGEATYYILVDDTNFVSSTGVMAGATLYTKGADTNLVGNTITGIGRNRIILVKNTLSLIPFSATTYAKRSYSAGVFADLVDINGDTSTDGNALDFAYGFTTSISAQDFIDGGADILKFGDKVAFKTTITKANLYRWTAIYLGYNGGIYKIADIPATMTVGTTGIGANFTGDSATRYGTAQFESIGGTIYLTLTFDKQPPLDVQFYATFEPNTASISVNTGKSYVYNYDGSGNNTLLSQTTVTTGASNNFGGSGIVYGDASEKTLAFTIPGNPDFYLKGWVVVTKSTGAVAMTYSYPSNKTATGSSQVSYQDFFAENMNLFASLFEGSTNYEIVPYVVQRTVTITLSKGSGDAGSNNTVTFYAGGAGLDLASYGSAYTKTGYTATGWSSNSPAITMTDATSTVLSGLALSGANYHNTSFTLSRTYTAKTYKIFFETQNDDVISTQINYVQGGTTTASRTISRYTVAGADYNKYYMEITYDTWFALPNLGRAGYAFNGWVDYTSIPRDMYTQGTDNAIYQVPNDLHLTPSFTARTYTVEIISGGGSFSGGLKYINSTVTYGTALLADVTANPTRPGFTFDGWYMTINGASTYEQITTSTLMDKTIGSFDVIANVTSTGETYNKISIYAAWARIADYYELDAEPSYTHDYTGSEQTIVAINDIIAGGISSLDYLTEFGAGNILAEAMDYVYWDLTYCSTENGTYTSTLPGSARANATLTTLYVTNVAESGFYKFVLKASSGSVAVNQTMRDQGSIIADTKTIHVTINPLQVLTQNTYASHTWSATYDGTASPEIIDSDGTTETEISTLYSTLINIDKLYVTNHVVGNKVGNTFTAGANVGTYDTVRFYVDFVNGYTYTAGNFANIEYDSTLGKYYFDQSHTVSINPLTVTLTPIVTTVAYTESQQKITFSSGVNTSAISAIITATGTMTAGNVGSANEDTQVAGSTFTKTNDAISGDVLSNFNVVLGGSVLVKGNVESVNQFATHVFTKASSSASLYNAIANEDYITVTGVQVGQQSSFDPTAIAPIGYTTIVDNGETYVYALDGTLLFQLNNNATTVNLYSMFEVHSITFESGHDTTTYQSGTYYYFNTYTVPSGDTEADVALGLLTNGFNSRSTVNNIESNKTYYIGYSDILPVTFTETEGRGVASDVTKYLKLDSALDYMPEATGYTFTGWNVTSGATFVSVANTSQVTVSIPNASSWQGNTSGFTCQAVWNAQTPNITATVVGYQASASEGGIAISFYDIFSGVTGTTETEKLQSILSNFVEGKTIQDYEIKWFIGTGDGKVEATDRYVSGGSTQFGLYCNTTDNGTYTLGIGYDGYFGYVPFTVTFSVVELELNEATRNFTYAYGVNQASNVTINVPASTAASTSYVLASSLNSSANIYFTIEKVADANGNAITPVSVNQIVDAGTYTVTLAYNATIYTTTSNQSFNVVVAKQSFEFTDTYLKSKLGMAGEAFEKTFGEGNSVLQVSSGTLFTNAQDQGKELPFNITFTATGVSGDGTTTVPGTYPIESASSANDNYTFTVSSSDRPNLKINANAADTLYFSLGTITYKDANGNVVPSYIYDGVNLTTASLAYDSANSIWKLSLSDANSKVRAIWDVNVYLQVDQTTQNAMTDSDIDANDYSITFTAFKNAGTYGQGIFAITPSGVAPYSTVSTAQTGESLVISPKEVSITAISKVFDNDNTFDSTTDTLTLSGVVAGENFTANGSYADYKAGTGIDVSNITFTAVGGALLTNYTFPTSYNAGAITASNDTVTITAIDNSKEYGQVRDSIALSLEFVGANFGTLNSELFENVTFTIVNPVYSTGGWLKVGTYDVNVTMTSASLSNANYTAGNPLVLQLTITAKTLGLSYPTIEKQYNKQTNVEQNVFVTGLCQGDAQVAITATYDNANVGTGKTVTLVPSGTDLANYVLETYTITGSIVARTSTILSLITEPSGGFVDGNHATVAGGTTVGNNFTYDIGAYSNETTGMTVMNAIPNPAKTGYTFGGWSASGYATVSGDNIKTVIGTALANGQNAVLTAKWALNSYVVAKTEGNHTSITVANSANYCDLVEFSASADAGYSLVVGANYNNGVTDVSVQVTDNNNGTYSFKMPAYDVTIVTSTEANEYNISYTTNGGTFVSAYPSKHTYGVETTIPNLTKTGYTFDGWVVDETGEPQKDLKLGETDYTANISLVASFTANTYRIYFDPSFTNPATNVNADFSGEIKETLTLDETFGYYYKEIQFDDEISLPSPALAGYSFNGWSLKQVADAFEVGEVVKKGVSTQVANESTFNYLEDIVLKSSFVAGEYTIKLSFNTLTANLSVAVQNGGNAVSLTPVAGNAGYSFDAVGGQTYTITVTPSAGYSIAPWDCEGEEGLTTSATLSFTGNRTISLQANANVNTITINASDADKDLLDFTATVNGAAATITDYAFEAPTGSVVIINVTVANGYTLNDVTTYSGCTVTRNNNQFTVGGFTTNASVRFSVQANEYDVTVVRDSHSAITFNDMAFISAANGWTRRVITGTELVFTPNVETGFSFTGVVLTKVGETTLSGEVETRTVSLNGNREDISSTGITIAIDSVGKVTISGFTEKFEIQLLTEVNAYDLTITTYALNTENEIVSGVSIIVEYSDAGFDGTVVYGDKITATVSTLETGYKFIGWYTQVEIDEGVVTYSNKVDILGNSLTIEMPAENVTRYAIFQITRVDLSLTVKTNDSTLNTNGGAVYDRSGINKITAQEHPLYKEKVKYIAKAERGYKFIGWFIGNDNVLDLEGYAVVNEEYSGLNVAKASVEFTITDNTTIYAKFEAKPVEVEYGTALMIRGTKTYPDGDPYYTIEWGTYDGSTFTVDSTYGAISPIKTYTGETVYMRITPNAGYFVENVYSIEENATFVSELVNYVQATNTYIYSISSLNADEGTYEAEVRFYSSETLVTVTFASGDNAVEAGQFLVDTTGDKARGLSVEANGTSSVRVVAITGTSISIVAYVRLGYEFVLNTQHNVDWTVSGTTSGNTEVITQGKNAYDKTLGFGYYTRITISGYSGGYINLGIKVKASRYKVNLYTPDTALPFITGIEVDGGTIITNISGGQKQQIKDLNNIEGFILEGFYTYADGSGYMYIDGTGNGTRAFNDNGYYWNGSAYVPSPYYTESSSEDYAGTFNLYAVYIMNKTAITINAIPEALKTEEPTVTAKAVISELNSANSWTIGSEPFYAEVIYGANISAVAPAFTNYAFAYWMVERLSLTGENSTIYLTKAKLSELEHNDFKEIYLTAVYYVRERVYATGGGTVKVSGYEYSISNNGMSKTRVEKETNVENFFSTADEITFKATPDFGYNFLGWYDEDGNEFASKDYDELTITPDLMESLTLEARFEGQAMNIIISAPVSEIGSIHRVYRNDDLISNWTAFSAQVGDRIEIQVNIQSIRYQAIWNNSHVNTEYSPDLRIYSYIVDKADESTTEENTIRLEAEFTSREFAFKLDYSLMEQASSNEVSLAGKIVYKGNELANNKTLNLVYGDSIILTLLVNNNYEISSITVNKEELSDYLARNRHESLDYTRGGTITIQTSDYDYDFEQEVDIKVVYRRINWLDDFDSTHRLTGNGTEDNPYIIASVKDLIFMTYMINVAGNDVYASASYELTNDIDMTGKYWHPIGTAENPFNGTFNFKVFEITNVSVDIRYEGTTRFDGLFGKITSNARIVKTENNIGLILAIAGGALAAIGVTVGIFLAIRAKKKRDLDRLANG